VDYIKQSKLFPEEEKKRQKKIDSEKRRLNAIERKKDFEKDLKIHKLKELKPKKEYYTCPKCGLIMHWKVAWGRRDGCPRCNIKFKKEDIFELSE